MRGRTACLLVSLSALALFGLASAPSANASLGAARLSALSVATRWTFDQPGSPIPAQPTGEMTQAYSLAEFASGPSTHGLASLWWPGSAGADFGPVYGFPAYPVRAEAFNPQTPHKQQTDYGPYTTMDAKATGTSAEAATTWQQSEPQLAQAIVTGDYASSSATQEKGNLAVSEGTAQANDVSIAGGLIHIDSVITKGRAVTNGKNGTVSGQTVVTGATVQGQGVTIDDKGVHIGDQTVPVLDPINGGQVQQALQQAGITVKVADPVDTVKGSDAQRVLGGLVIQFESGALNDVVPQQIRDQLKNYVQFNQSMTLSIGAVTVDSETLGGIVVPVPPPPPPPPPPGGSGPVGSAPSSTGGLGNVFGGSGPTGGSGSAAGSASGSAGGTISTALPIPIAPGKPVSALLVAFGFLVVAGSSRVLRVIAERAVAGTPGERCPLEDR